MIPMTPSEMEEKIRDLETENSELQAEVSEERAAKDEAEERMDDAYDAKDEAVGALRDEKRKHLVMLRRLEFSLHGLCPVCLGIVEHKTACDLKLAIWQIDHELARAEYAII